MMSTQDDAMSTQDDAISTPDDAMMPTFATWYHTMDSCFLFLVLHSFDCQILVDR